MNIIMTGSTSFVGAATVRELLRRGHTVTAIVRPDSSKLDTILEGNEEALLTGHLLVTENDLSEPEKLLEKVTKPQDVFCHFGWGGSGSASRTDKALQEKNMEISLETIRTAKALGCKKFLFSGSQAEYGMHQDLITEDTVCEPKSLYGEAKLAMREKGEKLCDELGLRYIHARIFSAYGPGDHPWTLVESCLDTFLSNKEMSLGACTQKWNFLYIDDLARGMAALCEAPESAFEGLKNPVFNFGGAETKVLKEFVEEIHELCGGVSFIVAVIYLIMKLLYWDRFMAGMAPLLIGMCFLGSVQIFFIGLLGEYIMSINTRVMHRPLVVEEERINFDTPAGAQEEV